MHAAMSLSLTSAILGAFLALVLGVGLWGFGKSRSMEAFLVAERRVGPAALLATLLATILGASSTVGLAGLVYSRGLTGIWWLLVGVPGLVGLATLAPRLTPAGVYTLPQLMERWYGKGVRRASAALIAAAWLGVVAAQLGAAGSVLAAGFGGRGGVWTGVAAGVFVLYTAAGGQRSVIRTDVLQALVIASGLALAAGFALRTTGGLRALTRALPADHLRFPLSQGFGTVDLVELLLVVGATYLVGPDMLSRLFCSRSVSSARRAFLSSAVALPVLAGLVTLLGLLARVLLPDIGARQSASALPLLASVVLPALPSALLSLALLSAFLSSADTTLLTLASVVALDLLPRSRQSVPGVRVAVLGGGLASLAVALWSGGIVSSLLLGYTVFTCGLAVPVLAGMVGHPMRPGAALASAALGGGMGLAGRLAGVPLLVIGGFALCALVWAADTALRGAARSRRDAQ